MLNRNVTPWFAMNDDEKEAYLDSLNKANLIGQEERRERPSRRDLVVFYSLIILDLVIVGSVVSYILWQNSQF